VQGRLRFFSATASVVLGETGSVLIHGDATPERADIWGKAAARALMKDVNSGEIAFFSKDGGVREVRS
jgi:hypothetical protein